jgi:hypothetical protein
MVAAAVDTYNHGYRGKYDGGYGRGGRGGGRGGGFGGNPVPVPDMNLSVLFPLPLFISGTPFYFIFSSHLLPLIPTFKET